MSGWLPVLKRPNMVTRAHGCMILKVHLLMRETFTLCELLLNFCTTHPN